MTAKVTYYEAKVNNTEDYGTHIDFNMSVRIDPEPDRKARFMLTITDKECVIEVMKG